MERNKGKNIAPPPYEKWTDENEAEFVWLTETDIELEDTALGRMKAQRTAEFEAAFETMSKEKQKEFLDKLQKKHQDGQM